jgi:isopentenyl-diphosphate delta-isomerase
VEDSKQFEIRKQDHVRIALGSEVQTTHLSQLDRVQLIHEALPEINFEDVSLETTVFGLPVLSPFFVSSMTAGHPEAKNINLRLAKACEEKGWLMGVGSQRRELIDSEAAKEWSEIREQAPNALLFGNLGLSQLITTPLEAVQTLVDNLEAEGLFIHTNPLQECLQHEGTPQFRGGLEALKNLCAAMDIPVVLKEVGCGFSRLTLSKLDQVGLAAVDVSGLGGTHWGRVEALRNAKRTTEIRSGDQSLGEVFGDWGISTVQSLINIKELNPDYQVWASGGIRSGLDAAKLLALGAQMAGIAKPFLESALREIETGKSCLIPLMQKLEDELRISMFCTGCVNSEQLRSRGVWEWKL